MAKTQHISQRDKYRKTQSNYKHRLTNPWSQSRKTRSSSDLLWLEVTDDSVDVIEDLIDEGHHLSNLYLDKVSSALLGNLDESVTGHVLDTIMGLCHGMEKRRIVTS